MAQAQCKHSPNQQQLLGSLQRICQQANTSWALHLMSSQYKALLRRRIQLQVDRQLALHAHSSYAG